MSVVVGNVNVYYIICLYHSFAQRFTDPAQFNVCSTINHFQRDTHLPILLMTSVSSLPSSALQAARTAVQAALAEHPEADGHSATTKDGHVGDEGSPEPGEIQEVDMQAQAETIRTVFSDPKNFNVKVFSFQANCHPMFIF